jgi:beta-mannosidase
MTVKVIDFDGNLYSDEGFEVDIPANSSLVYYDTLQSALIGNLNPRKLMILVTLKGLFVSFVKTANILYLVPPKDLELEVPHIEKKIAETSTGYKITLTCDKLVKNLYLSSSLKGEFSNNYFDMFPGESVDVEFTTPKKNPKISDLFMIKSLIDTY